MNATYKLHNIVVFSHEGKHQARAIVKGGEVRSKTITGKSGPRRAIAHVCRMIDKALKTPKASRINGGR